SVIDAAHAALRSTRGAAMAIAELRHAERVVRFAGVGNIAASIHDHHQTWNMVSYNGTVGHELRKVQEFTYAWPENGLLVMHSDGLTSRWSLAAYPGLAARHPSMTAAVLYRDFRRGRDDVTVLVARNLQSDY